MSREFALPLLALLVAACGGGSGGERAMATPPDTTLAAGLGAPVAGGRVHLVRVHTRPDHYEFSPMVVRLRPGDVLRFVHTGYLAESIAFDDTDLAPGGAAFLHARRLTDGILLTRPGQTYDVSFLGAPPGRYPFLSVPHARMGMRGVAVVE